MSHPPDKTALGTNPWKCAIILEELNLPYENRFLGPDDVKRPPYTDLNPNGRVPCIEDPNTGMIIWESVAINEYLVQTYDLEEKLWFSKGPEYFFMKQWLCFQMSGQGPYYGQGLYCASPPVLFYSERYLNIGHPNSRMVCLSTLGIPAVRGHSLPTGNTARNRCARYRP
jgi:Glutathione S-transferase, N-terminal domain